MDISNKDTSTFCYNNSMTFMGEQLFETNPLPELSLLLQFSPLNNFESLKGTASN